MKNSLETRLGLFFALAFVAGLVLLELVGGFEFFRKGIDLKARTEALPGVGRVVEAASLLPEDGEAKRSLVAAIHAKLASYDPVRPILPWLAAIARYRWVDQLRRIYKANDTAQEIDDLPGIDDPESEVTARISLDRLFAQLPDGQVRAIELVKIEGLSVAEAASACGQSESLVKVNIHRGLKKLAALIEKA